MAGTIQTITDKSAFESIFYQNFSGGDMFLKTSNGNLKIAFLGYTDGQIAFRIPYIKSMPETALVFARKDETTVYAEIKTIEKQEADVFIFSPIKVQIIFGARRENRAPVAGTGEGKNLLFVSHIASEFNLFDSVSIEKKKTEFIRDKVLSDLNKIFPNVSVHFCAEESGDSRMRFFNENGNRPIFISDISKPPQDGDKTDYAYYKEFIYAKEQFNMKRKNLISEVSVPILYRGMIPFGYITVNNTVTLDQSCIQILKRAAVLSEQMMIRGGVIRDICDERLLVSDISRGGIGIVFRDRKFVRFFKEKRTASFDLILSNGSIVAIAAIVKNIALLDSKIIKVGCEIRSVDESCKAEYEEYLAKHLPPPEPPKEQAPAVPAEKSEPAVQ
jgi:hypothetical protein